MKDKLLIFKDDKIDFKSEIYILILVMIISGVFGFIYETIFYRIDLGYFVKRGSSFGPWIPIYAFGGLFITLFTYKLKHKPLLVFTLNTIITAILEYGTGFVLYEYFHKRLWNYNIEIWNFGNINGYICLRSILFFGLSSLFLIYILIPLIIKIYKNFSNKYFAKITIILGTIFLVDVILYMMVH